MRRPLEHLGSFLPAALALALPTVFVPIAVDSFILPRVSIVVSGACIGAGLAVLFPGGPGLGRLRLPLFAGAVAAVLAFAFSVSWPLSLTGAYTRYESLPVRMAYLGLFAVPVWLLRSERSRKWVVPAFVAGTGLASLEAILQGATGVAFRPDGNVGNANLLAALIAMATPLAVAYGLRRGRFLFVWWLGVAILVGGLIATTSRSGGLAVLAGCLALAVFALRGRLAVGAAVASAAAVLLTLVAIFLSPLRLLNGDTGPIRTHLWIDALHMVATRPFTGWGEDATGLVFGRFLSGDWAAPGVTFDRAHAGLLDLAAMQGLLGVVALGWVLIVLLRQSWYLRFTVAAGPLAAACIGYTVWVAFNFDWAPATGAFWLLAGTAWSLVRSVETEGVVPDQSGDSTQIRPGRSFRSLGAVGLAMGAVWLGAMPVLADIWYYEGRTELAVVADPLQARYHRALGEGLLAQGNSSRGMNELRLAVNLGETDPAVYVELGDEEQRLGELAQARQDYRAALTIDPFFAPAQQRLAGSGAAGSA